jgi:hypothetical protein
MNVNDNNDNDNNDNNSIVENDASSTSTKTNWLHWCNHMTCFCRCIRASISSSGQNGKRLPCYSCI